RRWAPLTSAWPGGALAPDLPGHGETPPPTGGHYKAGDAAIAAWRAAEDAGITGGDVVVLGHGWGGFAAEVLAAAGRASKLVLVDGLGGPWMSADDLVADRHRWLNDVLADPAALAPPTVAPDPRLAHAYSSVWARDFVGHMRRAITIPVLAVETPESVTPDPRQRLADYTGPSAIVEVDSIDAVSVDVLQA
ncbi:MAG: alpha/beta hydrolase, partial [Acidimicrobiia bacterium]|nr:alpha/beta hydrolase [Acidimicrobiia bacterium]